MGIERMADGSVVVTQPLARRGLNVKVRVGLGENGRPEVWAVTIIPETWTSAEDTGPVKQPIKSEHLREVGLSEPMAEAVGDETFLQHIATTVAARASAGGQVVASGRGATYKDGQLARIARYFLDAQSSAPRRAVLATLERLAAEDDIVLTPTQLRDRLRACYERGFLLKIDDPGKAGAIQGPNLPVTEGDEVVYEDEQGSFVLRGDESGEWERVPVGEQKRPSEIKDKENEHA
jgi:hypothetical protein